MVKRIKMVIIDDISSVVEGIAKLINWADEGIEVVGTAFNGEQGLALVEEHRPQIVLTDIRMPKMDGLEMTRRIMQVVPNCKVILLSGYTDFEYAREGIRIGAQDFITKPFSKEDIVSIVRKAKQAINAEQNKQYYIESMERKVEESMPYLQNEFLHLCMHHQVTNKEMFSKWRFLEIPLPEQNLQVILVEISELQKQLRPMNMKEAELIRFAIQNILMETVEAETEGIVFRDGPLKMVVLFHAPDGFDEFQLAERCFRNVHHYLRFEVSIGMSQRVENIVNLCDAYAEANKALSYHFYTGGKGVISIKDINTDSRRWMLGDAMSLEKELIFAIRSGNEEKGLAVLSDIFASWPDGKDMPEPRYLHSVCYELAYIMIRVLLEIKPYEQVRQIEKALWEYQTQEQVVLEDLQYMLKDICKQGCGLIETELASDAHRVIGEAIQYIHENLDVELTIEHVSSQVHISGSYFSNLFKKVTGMTFSQYVTQTRIDKAKELILQGEQIQNIAYALGYKERRYFSSVFKKQTGFTPSEFKDDYLGFEPQ